MQPDGVVGGVTVGDLSLALVQRGRVGETQLIPASWIADVADPPAASIAAFAAAPDADTRPTKGYRSAFWVVEPGRSFSASGIFGQGCYVDLEHDLVVARLSSAPEALSEERRAEAMNAIGALVARLEVTS